MDEFALDTSSAPKRVDQLDARQRHARRLEWFRAEKYRQMNNREWRAKCERMYDNDQWDPAEAAKLLDRGQNPVVFNEVKPMTDWLIGTERRMRVDFTVTPRNSMDEAAMTDAETKKNLLKFIDDSNRAGFERSYAFDDAAKAGLGWLEVGVRGDQTDIPVYVRSEPWRNMWHDSFGPRRDLTDSRYVFRYKELDLDLALAFFPGKEKEILRARQGVLTGGSMTSFGGSFSGGIADDLMPQGDRALDMDIIAPIGFWNPRERVAFLECWAYEPWAGRKSRSSPSTFDRGAMRMRVSIMTEWDTIYEDWSPYAHNRFPFIPVWAYRNKATLLPYSPILPLISKQEALNHAMSRATWEISVNQMILEKGAYDPQLMTVTEIQREIASPDGVVLLAPGGITKFKDRRGLDNAQAHMMLADRLAMSMRNESGATQENLGRDSNVVSGIGIGKKQDQGSLLTTELFDNTLLARQMEGDITLSVAEQYVTKPVVITVPGERAQYTSHGLNQPQADGSTLNDITARQAKFVVGEQAWRANLAQAAFESMLDLLGKLAPVAPQIVTSMLDLVFEYADLPNKQAILQRIRQVTGQPGPDGKISPEQQQAMQQDQQKKQLEYQAQMAKFKADIDAAAAKGTQLNAAAVKTQMEALYIAAQAAQVLTLAPAIAPVADELAISAGFHDQHGEPALGGPVPVQATPQPMPPRPGGPLVGHEAGIQTVRPDGVQPGAMQ